jgi:hypothetical protein
MVDGIGALFSRNHARLSRLRILFRGKGAEALVFPLPSALIYGKLQPRIELNDEFKKDFWSQFPGLVWSNPKAGDAVRIRAALLNPKFHVLLAIAVEFGCERLMEEWKILQADPLTDTSRAAPSVNRILKNILRGYQQAGA